MITAIICAAGKGERAQLNKNKILAPLYGEPVIYHTVKAFYGVADEIIIVCSAADMPEITAICSKFGAKYALGGNTRAESVYAGLKQASGEITLIHDGARPFVTKKIIFDCVESVKKYGSGVCALPLTDTVVFANGDCVESVPERNKLFCVQTPQGFFTEDIKKAYNMAELTGFSGTDDSSVYSKFISPAHLYSGEPFNTKITYKNDFPTHSLPEIADKNLRVGYGTDVHAFGGKKNYVTLCGVKIPNGKGLVAHSDGDVAVHAVMDAVLSAAGLKDIGHYFPDADESLLDANSLKMLEKVVKLALNEGYCVVNLSLTIQAERPKLAPFIDGMIRNIANTLKTDVQNVAISAGTCEKLGFVGEGLGICATAVVLLKSNKN